MHVIKELVRNHNSSKSCTIGTESFIKTTGNQTQISLFNFTITVDCVFTVFASCGEGSAQGAGARKKAGMDGEERWVSKANRT